MYRVLKQHINEISTKIDDSIVYQKQCLLLSNWLLELKTKIKKNKNLFEDIDLFNNLQICLNTLKSTIITLSENFWKNIALVTPTTEPVKIFLENTFKIKELLEDLNLSSFEPTSEDYQSDFHFLYLIFSNSSKKTHANLRLESIDDFLISKGLLKCQDFKNNLINDIFTNITEFKLDHNTFKIDQQIGHGTSGSVFKAYNEKREIVAIKQLHSTDLKEKEITLLKREVMILSSLNHPYIIKFIGCTFTSPYWLVTEFMSNGSLFDKLRKGKSIDSTTLTKIAYQIAEGMAYLHSENIVHRDLKTLNILLDSNLIPRICDFGISREIDSDNVMTGSIGTYNYMAPEIINNHPYTSKVDVFSFALVLWEMLTKDIPYRKYKQFDMMKAITSNIRPKIPLCSDFLKNLIQDCWNEDQFLRPSFDIIVKRMKSNLI